MFEVARDALSGMFHRASGQPGDTARRVCLWESFDDRIWPSQTVIPWLEYQPPRRGWACEACGASIAWLE
jgi:hypothetical protein